MKVKEFKQVGSTTDFNAAVSTSSASSLATAIGEKASALEEIPFKGNETIAFEECHSLMTVFRELFETEDDPHGTGELLELKAILKAAKKYQKTFNHEEGKHLMTGV